MRKGFIDMWLMIGILMMLLVFALLIYFQQTGQNFLQPMLEWVGGGGSFGGAGASGSW